jgi:hypothetical protein
VGSNLDYPLIKDQSDKLKLVPQSHVFHVIQELNAVSIQAIRDCLLTTLYDIISKRKMSAEVGDARTSNLPDTGEEEWGADIERGAWLGFADV